MTKEHFKYPRTMHLPWSPGLTDDDRCMHSISNLLDYVVITEKRDGENTTIYHDGYHARSIDGHGKSYQSHIGQLQGSIGYLIPKGLRICGENIFAKHSIPYDNLQSYFEIFSVWDGETCLSWDDTVSFVNDLSISSGIELITVPVLWRGDCNESFLENFHKSIDCSKQEGFVVRVERSFHIDKFVDCVGKWVRADHVKANKHWSKHIIKNQLK